MKNKKVVLRLTEDQMRDVVLPYYIKEGKNDKNVLSEEIKNVSKGGRIIYSNKQTLDLPEFDPEFPRQMLGLNIEGYKRREVKVKRNKNDISKTIMVEVVTDFGKDGDSRRMKALELIKGVQPKVKHDSRVGTTISKIFDFDEINRAVVKGEMRQYLVLTLPRNVEVNINPN